MAKPFQLSQFLPYQLAVVAERISHRLSVDYGRSHDLSLAEWRVLVHLQYCGVVSVRDIQVYTNLIKSRVSRAVTRLESAGYVEKNASQSDARLIEIALTQKGEAALSEVIAAATDSEARLMNGVSEKDLSVFFRVIEHFHNVLDEDPDAKPRPKPDPTVW